MIAPEPLSITQTRASSIECAADFRIRRLAHEDWEIHILSSTARNWAIQATGREAANEVDIPIRTDLAGVNDFTYQARKRGYRTEYVGPRGVIYL